MRIPKNYILKSLFIIFCSCSLVKNAYSQNWEVDLLKNINPNPPSSKVWKGFSATAEPISLSLPIGLFTVALLENNKSLKEQSIEVMESLALASIATEGLKIIVDRKRPYERYTDIYPHDYEIGKSFPSGHAALAFSTATSLSIQFKKWYIVAPAYLWATSVSYSRLYLGQHYPSDILASALVGSGSAWISYKANQWLKNKRQHRKISNLLILLQ